MKDERVVPFARPAGRAGKAVSGRMTFNNGQLFIPVMRTELPPRWAVKDGQISLSDGSSMPIDVCLVAQSLNEPGEMGWLDREGDRFGGEFAVGPEHEGVIRHAVFSPLSWDLTIDVSATADGEIVELKLGLERAT